MNGKRKVFLGMATVFLLLQFMQPERNNDGDPNHTNFLHAFPVPENVGKILSNSCFDCHSNYTKYPWYTMIQPFGRWMNSHIVKGKSELNFDEFNSYSQRRKMSKLKSISSSIEDRTMPLSSYTLIHQNAKLSGKEQKIITDWASAVLDSLQKKDNR
ncbi:MAG: cytochrome C [Sphingobacteriales bacterium]|nr:MAG: cytochrome C [Sphingobacteriales bacterium]